MSFLLADCSHRVGHPIHQRPYCTAAAWAAARPSTTSMIAKTTDLRPDASIDRGAAPLKSRVPLLFVYPRHTTRMCNDCRVRLLRSGSLLPAAPSSWPSLTSLAQVLRLPAAAAKPQRPAAVAPPAYFGPGGGAGRWSLQAAAVDGAVRRGPSGVSGTHPHNHKADEGRRTRGGPPAQLRRAWRGGVNDQFTAVRRFRTLYALWLICGPPSGRAVLLGPWGTLLASGGAV